jgi:hypothetical protein
MSKPPLYCIHNRDWPVNSLTGNALTWNALFAEGTLMGAVLKSAYESAANPNRGPLPAEALELFKSQVRQNG